MQENPVRDMTDTMVGAVVQLAIANDRAQNRHHNEVAALNRKIDELQRVIEDQADQIRTLWAALDTPPPADDDVSDAGPA